MIDIDEVREEDFKNNPAVKAEYEKMRPVYKLIGRLIEARTRAGLTQSQIAERMKTTQSVVSRMESGGSMPSIKMVTRYALVAAVPLVRPRNP